MAAIHKILLFLTPALLMLAACGDDDASPAATTSGPTTTSTASPAPTASAAGTRYTNDTFGYSLELPTGWRAATQFMESYGALGAVPQGTKDSSSWAVLTDVSTEEESRFVAQAVPTPGLTGLEPWLGFYLLGTVEVFPTTYDIDQQLVSVKDGNVWHIVTDVRDFPLGSQSPGTRYTVEILNDYWHYVFDTVFLPATVSGCPDCTGFIIETAVAGRSPLESPGPIEPPPIAYPKEAFESIAASFVPTAASPTSAAPLTYTDPTNTYSFDYPATWHLSPAEDNAGNAILYSYDLASIPSGEIGMPVPKDKLKVFFWIAEGINVPLEQWLAEGHNGPGQVSPPTIISQSDTSLGGKQGLNEVLESDGTQDSSYYIPLGGDRVFVVNAGPSDSQVWPEFEPVLASVRFAP